ncbi:MAG TPA: hypothetical protein VJ819_17275 [Nocardioidaceae bacterium]|nr:hypothetical protein [Nocardioidaceae bacterium]
MEILAWLVPSAVVTVLAMIWAAWAGRPRRAEADRSEAAYERFSQAIARAHPGAGRPRPSAVRDRSTGIAVRPSRRPTASRPGQDADTRRSA